MEKRYLEYNEPSDGPKCRLQIEFEPDGHAVVLLNDSSAANFVRETEINGIFSDFSAADVRCLKLDLNKDSTTPAVESDYPLSSYVLATDGKSLLVPLADIKESRHWAVAGLVITGKQFLRRPIHRAHLLAKDVKTQFVQDHYGDSWNDSFFKEPRVLDDVPATAFVAMESIMAIAKQLFLAKDYAVALKKYKKSFHYAYSYFPEDLATADLETLTNFKVNSLLNMGLCNTKMGNFEEAISNLDYAFQIPGISKLQLAKTYFRKGVALANLSDEDEALEFLRKAEQLSSDPAINKEIEKCVSMQQIRKGKQRDRLRRAFS